MMKTITPFLKYFMMCKALNGEKIIEETESI
jgi:hypothetical protein